MSELKARLSLLASTAMLLTPVPTLAQTAETRTTSVEATEAEDGAEAIQGGIQDIIVTARRRAESQQSAPVTLTTFTGADLQERGVTEFTKLAQITPGIGFDEFPKGSPRVYFRGVGGGGNGAGGDPGAVAFLDGVYLARPPMLGIDFYDLERIEALKGPQGTLFGKNAVAGSINFITNKPVDQLEASAQLTLGEYGQTNGNLMINTPITDGIAARLVLGAVSNDGYRKTFDGRSLDAEQKLSGRLHIRSHLGASTTLTLSGDVIDHDNSEASRYNVLLLPFTPGVGRADYDKPRRANPDQPGFTRVTTGGLRAELSHDFGFANWTTQTSWRTVTYDHVNDLDGTDVATNAAIGLPVSGIRTLAQEQADSYSVETRLTSQPGAAFQWVTGLFYNRDEIHRERETQQSATPTTLNRFFGDSENNSYAAFGEIEYGFDFGLKVFGGGRYTYEKKRYGAKRLTGPLAAPITNYDTSMAPGIFDDGEFTYRVGINYRINENVFLFGTISTGFKSGVFAEQPSSAMLATIPTAPEHGRNYEIGFKTDWFERRLRVNMSAFKMDYTDLETGKVVPDLTQGPTGTRFTIDTADAVIKGIESEVTIVPAPWIDATVRYAYLHPYFTRFIQTSGFDAAGNPQFTDGAGNRLSRTPEHAVTADLGLQTDRFASWGWLRAQVSMDYQSDIYDNNINDFVEYRRPRTLWDASVTYHMDDRYSVQAWVKNLTDEEYRTWQTSSAFYHYVNYGAPRQFGVTLAAKFR